jgi:hypothetical protein
MRRRRPFGRWLGGRRSGVRGRGCARAGPYLLASLASRFALEDLGQEEERLALAARQGEHARGLDERGPLAEPHVRDVRARRQRLCLAERDGPELRTRGVGAGPLVGAPRGRGERGVPVEVLGDGARGSRRELGVRARAALRPTHVGAEGRVAAEVAGRGVGERAEHAEEASGRPVVAVEGEELVGRRGRLDEREVGVGALVVEVVRVRGGGVVVVVGLLAVRRRRRRVGARAPPALGLRARTGEDRARRSRLCLCRVARRGSGASGRTSARSARLRCTVAATRPASVPSAHCASHWTSWSHRDAVGRSRRSAALSPSDASRPSTKAAYRS